ncbi:GNAT family N-acetyltransferase [Falsarthrobacter nasiphocae]
MGTALLLDRLAAAGHSGRTSADARFYALVDGPAGGPEPRLSAVAFAGVNVFPHGDWSRALGPLAERLFAPHERRPASIYGPSSAVLPLWDELERGGLRAAEERRHQPLLAMDGDDLELAEPYQTGPARKVAPSRLEDEAALLRASVAMFTEEVGYSPVEPSVWAGRVIRPDAASYVQRVRQLITQGRSFSHVENGEVLFKAEFAAVTPEAAFVQGVWLAPRLRGRGLSSGYMRALAVHGLASSRRVCLYANGYNYAALASYARAGFRQVGTFSTIML